MKTLNDVSTKRNLSVHGSINSKRRVFPFNKKRDLRGQKNPMNKMAGRPKGSLNKPEQTLQLAQKNSMNKMAGRPKGSLNKPKVTLQKPKVTLQLAQSKVNDKAVTLRTLRKGGLKELTIRKPLKTPPIFKDIKNSIINDKNTIYMNSKKTKIIQMNDKLIKKINDVIFSAMKMRESLV